MQAHETGFAAVEREHYRTLNFNSATPLNDSYMSRVIRAALYTRVATVEFSGTNLGSCTGMFEQAALVLENARRYARTPITKFLLSSTGLDEHHFSRIICAVQRTPRLMDPTGCPDVDTEDLEMRLELLNVSIFQMYMPDPLHQVDHGIVFCDSLHYCLHGKHDLVAALTLWRIFCCR